MKSSLENIIFKCLAIPIESDIPTTLTDSNLEGKTPRARPRGNWSANIKEWSNPTNTSDPPENCHLTVKKMPKT